MVATQDEILYDFPPPLDGQQIEWEGTTIGLANVVTRTKSRTKVSDKTIDRLDGRREDLVNSAVEHMVLHAGKEPMDLHDVVIHGVRVRAITNSPHLIDFWRDNWYGVEEWEKLTGNRVQEKPQILVYAFGGVEKEPEAAYYSRKTNSVIFFNTAYYGQLKSWVLGAVGRVLAEEYGIHSIHGAGVEKDGKGILYIAPTGTGKSTSSYGLMHLQNTRFHSDDWVYIRYVYRTRDGKLVSPRRIEDEQGNAILGYRCFRWLEEHPVSRAKVLGLTLENREVELSARDLLLEEGVQAYAFISEKLFYLRSNIVENFPEAAYQLLHSRFENIPDVSPAFKEQHGELLKELADRVVRSDNAELNAFFQRMSRDEVIAAMARLFAFDNARAMLDITKVFGRDQVYSNPLEPLRLTDVFLLKRNFQEDEVIARLTLDRFMERLLIGETPMGTREIAYNAYRATDDEAERRYIAVLEKEAKAQGTPLYRLLLKSPDVPETLLEDFELFRQMYQATACYDLNTIIQKDPSVKDKMEAVRRTMLVITAAVDKRPERLRCQIGDYRNFVGI